MKRTLLVAVSTFVLVGSALTGCGAINAAKKVKQAANAIGDADKDAKDFQAKLDRSKTATFSATYTIKKPGAPDDTITIAQKPPKSMYKQADSLLIDDGSKLYTCSKSDGKDQCVEVGAHTDVGLFGYAGFGFAFNPAAIPGLFLTAALLPGVNASKSSRSIVGLQSDCVALSFTEGTDSGKKYEGCTSADGVLTYSLDTNGTEVTLTKYDTTVSESAFTLPAPGKSVEDLTREATSTTTSTTTVETTTSSTVGDTTTSIADTTTSTP